MIHFLRIALYVLGGFTLVYALLLGYQTEWLLTNISQTLFYRATCVTLLLSSIGGVMWAWQGRSIDRAFTPFCACSIALGIGLLTNRQATIELFSANFLLLILIICLIFNSAALFASAFFLMPPRKKH